MTIFMTSGEEEGESVCSPNTQLLLTLSELLEVSNKRNIVLSMDEVNTHADPDALMTC